MTRLPHIFSLCLMLCFALGCTPQTEEAELTSPLGPKSTNTLVSSEPTPTEEVTASPTASSLATSSAALSPTSTQQASVDSLTLEPMKMPTETPTATFTPVPTLDSDSDQGKLELLRQNLAIAINDTGNMSATDPFVHPEATFQIGSGGRMEWIKGQSNFFWGRMHMWMGSSRAPQVELTFDIPDGLELLQIVDVSSDDLLYSTGWGRKGDGEGLILLEKVEGTFLVKQLILNFDHFENLKITGVSPPPERLTYFVDEAIYEVIDGQSVLIIDEIFSPDNLFNLSPDNQHAVIKDKVFRLTAGQPLDQAERIDLPLPDASKYLKWVDTSIIAFDYWPIEDQEDQEDQYGEVTAPALIDISSGETTILKEFETWGVAVGVMAQGDGRAFFMQGDTLMIWEAGELSASGVYSSSGGIAFPSPDRSQAISTYVDNFVWNGIEIVSLFPPPIGNVETPISRVFWNSEGDWAVFNPQISGYDVDQFGLWLFAPETKEKIFLGFGTDYPVWVNERELIFYGDIKGEEMVLLFDLGSRTLKQVDLPAGTIPIHIAR
ncbi:MAG: hypothetical protein AAF633_04605 [Chloroflexota bacterium]